MSCQQVSRQFATLSPTTAAATSIQPEAAIAVITPEDPYVFTESVPNKPILFTAQKSRPRLAADTPNAIAGVCHFSSSNSHLKLPLTQLNGNAAKVVGATATAIGNRQMVAAIATTNLKHQQSQVKRQNAAVAVTAAPQLKRASPNVCIVRPQQQQQQQQQKQLHQLQLKQQRPSICLDQQQQPLLQHTPSLWQTPLLLEPAPATPAAAVLAAISPTTKQTASQTSTTNTVTPLALPLGIATTCVATAAPPTATALVSPLMQHQQLQQQQQQQTTNTTASVAAVSTLPPSRFHSTTLAQHLQKVECLKKPKKQLSAATAPSSNNNSLSPIAPTDTLAAKLNASLTDILPPLQAFEAPQHSVPDLLEIPVNVIYRKPHVQAAEEQSLLLNTATTAASSTSPPASLKSQHQQHNVFIPPITKLAHDTAASAPPQPQLPPPPPTTSTTTTTTSSMPAHHQSLKNAENIATPEEQVAVATTTTASTSTPLHKLLPTKRKLALTKTSGAYKKGRKSLSAAIATVRLADASAGGGASLNHAARTANGSVRCRPIAVVKLSDKEVSTDTTQLASPVVLPYCVQRHWMGGMHGMRLLELPMASAASTTPPSREERIEQYKSQLRRQALQLLTIKPLQKLPLHEARRRLLCVDGLLRKYQEHRDNSTDDINAPIKKCSFEACFNQSLTMANHCRQHIVHNNEQHMFVPCAALNANNLPCRLPVLNIANVLPPICGKHTKLSPIAVGAGVFGGGGGFVRVQPQNVLHVARAPNVTPQPIGDQLRLQQLQLKQTLIPQQQQKPQQRPQQPLQQQQPRVQIVGGYKPSTANSIEKPLQVRKRKVTTGANPVGRPQKRQRKSPIMSTTTLPMTTMTTVSLPPLSAVLQRKSSTTSLESIASNSYSSSSLPAMTINATAAIATNNNNGGHNDNNSALPPPALAPLSTFYNKNNNSGGIVFGNAAAPATPTMLNFGASASIAADLKEHEINEIVTQLAMVSHNNINSNNNNNNNSNNHYNNNNNHHNNHHHHHISYSSTNSNSNFTTVLGSTASLPPSSSSTDEFLTQDMLSICENSSPYASSEDTGLGGLSESELLSGSHDADEIPLGDTHLLEEHDLANVLSSLEVDAFSELFTAVRQDERDEVERALELADKHLKSLQQTIGSESDFLGDLLDADILSNTDMCSKMDMTSPDVSNADTSSLYFDNGSSVNTNASNSTGGLVQT